MSKVILICGKICSGKTYYAKQLKSKIHACAFSYDEMMEDLGIDHFDDKFDGIVPKIEQFIYKKTEEIILCGLNVILDFGFWSNEARNSVSLHFTQRNIQIEWHYIDISDDNWKANIAQRNKSLIENNYLDYYIDEEKMEGIRQGFEVPRKDDIDVWVNNIR